MATHNDLGKWGEQKATEFLLQNGFEILAQNWRFEKFEIDLIAKKDNVLRIVEVKTRSTNYFGYPEESITQHKQKMLVEGAEVYLNQMQGDIEVQFDIIAITKAKTTQIHFIEDAFWPEDYAEE